MKFELPPDDVRTGSSESKEGSTELLKLERGRLMHTGNFKAYFSGGLDVKGMNPLYLGVNTDDDPESNVSVSVYGRGHMKSWNGGQEDYGTTAVYKKDYLERVKVLCDSDEELHRALPPSVKRNPHEHLKSFNNEELSKLLEVGRFSGDEGMPTTPEYIYNQNEIEAVICYSEAEAEELKKIIESKPELKHIVIYLEKITSKVAEFLKSQNIPVTRKNVEDHRHDVPWAPIFEDNKKGTYRTKDLFTFEKYK